MCGAAPGGLPRTRRAVIVRSRIQLAAVLVVVSLAGSTHARTWRVELDGTGDYTDIQPAVDAAAPGDTIRIGPGRFATFHPITAPGWTEYTIVGVLKDALTFIGAGRDVTFVGPTQFSSPPSSNPKAFCSFGGFSSDISDLTIENVETGIMWERGTLIVESCTLRAQDPGFFALYLFIDGGVVHNCLFDLPLGGTAVGILNSLNNVRGVDISGCTIQGARFGVRVAYGAPNIDINNCVLDVGYLGIVYDQQSTGSIRQCHIQSAEQGGLVVANGSSVVVTDSEFAGGRRGVDVGAGSVASGSGLVIKGTTEASLTLYGGGWATFHGSHLLPASGWAVNCLTFTGAAVNVELSGNYWGTTDPLAIEASIHDSRYYSPNPYTVLYAPFANGPVPTETTSWGDLKALWR